VYAVCQLLAPGATCPFSLEIYFRDYVSYHLHSDATPVEHRQPVPLGFGNVRARSDGVGHVRIAGTATNETSSAVLGSVSGRDATITGTLIDGAGRIASVAGEGSTSPVHILRPVR
jgi:hypothetical protein